MTGEDFGTALRRWRELRRLSVRELAALTHHGKSQISDLENGVRRPRPEVAAHLDRILQAGGALVTVAQREGAPRPHPAEFVPTLVLPLEGCDDAMYRRTFVLALGGLAGLGVSAPMLAVEAARHGLTPGLAERRAEAPVDEWHAIVREYGYSYQTTAPAELSDGLVVDLLGIGHAVERQRDEAVLRELYRAASLLAAVMAMSVSNIGHLPHAERWWRTARATAERSGSAETAAWVRGQEVVRGLYERRPLGAVLRLVEEGERYAVAAPELLAGKAQALALAGRPEEAAAALHTLEGVFEGLPEEVTADRITLFGWGEDRLRFTETYVHCHLGDLRRADVAQRRAVAAFPAGDRRGPVQIALLRALALVRAGDVGEGMRLARDAVSGVRPADRIRPIVDSSARVLDAVPPAQRQRTPVTEFRDCLTAFGAPV